MRTAAVIINIAMVVGPDLFLLGHSKISKLIVTS